MVIEENPYFQRFFFKLVQLTNCWRESCKIFGIRHKTYQTTFLENYVINFFRVHTNRDSLIYTYIIICVCVCFISR